MALPVSLLTTRGCAVLAPDVKGPAGLGPHVGSIAGATLVRLTGAPDHFGSPALRPLKEEGHVLAPVSAEPTARIADGGTQDWGTLVEGAPRPSAAFQRAPFSDKATEALSPATRSTTRARGKDVLGAANRIEATLQREAFQGDAALARAVDLLIQMADSHGIHPSLTVGEFGAKPRDPSRIVAQRLGFNQMNPASNGKLFTAAHVLDTLGADFQFRTPYGVGTDGHFYLRGSFDPTVD